MKYGQGVTKYFREYSDKAAAKYMRKRRKRDRTYAIIKNRLYQTKWRNAHVELNRLRAKQGIMAKKMFWEIFKLAKLRKIK